MALTRTAKSCGSDAPMLASSLREEAQATVSNKLVTGKSTKETVKPLRGECRVDFRCDRGDYARVLTSLIAREASGALGARHSLRPLNFQGQDFKAKLAQKPRRDREAVFEQGGTKTLVMPGLDPGINLLRKSFLEADGLPGQARQ